MKPIPNLTQHCATPEQVAAGVIDLTEAQAVVLRDLLTFDRCPSYGEVADRAERIAHVAFDCFIRMGAAPVFKEAMIGGAPYLMGPLERALFRRGIRPVYSFSKRVSVETTLQDGAVSKTSTFVHSGWVRPLQTDD